LKSDNLVKSDKLITWKAIYILSPSGEQLEEEEEEEKEED
jgi:hypothetical protein